ncbi:tyrosinase family protein [Methylovulum psychrotolerans]|uniref:Oxidoreductase n=1 Tax=Methylovulum psychrotolerans TaxID=1704499 RepID=A0A2S5CHZ5_9GAMM|nr:tyrosinase family protein [Methylovulum psychrotolerans]POZ50424.1 oxidoreductase [Methylovulum psychrotolerans]
MKPSLTCLFAAVAMVCSSLAYGGSVRISAAEFVKDPAKVAALQKAVAAMKANNSADPTSTAYRASWQYWANTHGYLGLGSNSSGVVATYVPTQIANRCGGNQTCASYYSHLTDTPVPADGFTDAIWGTCQHGNLSFLPWHRLYLHFYERMLRKQSGTDDFNLPYWDYYQETGEHDVGVALPELVRGKSTGPLYDEFRTPGLNDYKTAIPANTASAEQAFDFTDFTSFSNQLQNQPHGAMHCGTGFGCRAPDMGLVPLAGLDPVFYMHHANIDRFWQCWLNRQAGGQTIDLAWAKKNLGMPDSWYDTKYQFVDENGQPVTVTIADVFTPGKIDTHYSQENNCQTSMPKATPPLTAAAKSAASFKLTAPLASTEATVLTGKVVKRGLKALGNINLLAANAKTAGVKAGHALLVIENVNAKTLPGVTYEIYLSNKKSPDRKVYIATFNYFGLFDSAHPHGDAAANIGTLKYDVQSELEALGLTSAADLEVQFVPSEAATAPEQGAAGEVTVGNILLLNADPAK